MPDKMHSCNHVVIMSRIGNRRESNEYLEAGAEYNRIIGLLHLAATGQAKHVCVGLKLNRVTKSHMHK
jgi:hypothetical protein